MKFVRWHCFITELRGTFPQIAEQGGWEQWWPKLRCENTKIEIDTSFICRNNDNEYDSCIIITNTSILGNPRSLGRTWCLEKTNKSLTQTMQKDDDDETYFQSLWFPLGFVVICNL